MTYHKVNQSGGYEFDNCSLSYTQYDYDDLVAFIREDSMKHIYMYDTAVSHDTLLYDFNLKVGDTLNQYTCPKYGLGGAGPCYVDSIDSVLIGSTYRKRFNIGGTGLSQSTYIIEGIGSNQGLLEEIGTEFEAGTWLDCFQQNGKTLYPDSTSACQKFYLGFPVIKQQLVHFSLYPNPASTQVTLQYQLPPSQARAEIKLYNAVGQLVESKALKGYVGNDDQNISALPNGIYYYTLLVNGVVEATNKLVVIH